METVFLFLILFTAILLFILNKQQEKMMATQKELAAKLNSISDELDKAQAEIVAAIQALKDALAAGGATTPEVDAAVTRLETGAQALDELNPDAPAPEA